MTSQVNLQNLAIDRKSLQGATQRRTFASTARWLTGLATAIVVAAVALWPMRDRLLAPVSKPVSSAPLSPVSAVTPKSNSLFQCAGWVEPRPTPIIVSSLAEGVIDRLTVIEGQPVKKGDPVAYLVEQDANLAIRLADAELAMRRSQVVSAEAALASAQQYFTDPTPRLAAVAEAEVQLAEVETQLATLPAQLRAAQSRQSVTEKELQTKTAAKEAVPAISLERSKGELETAKAQQEELHRQTEFLSRERTAIAGRLQVLRRQLELKVDEKRMLAEADAALVGAQAQVVRAEAELDVAKLGKERTIIRAPIDGHILALTSRPGSRLMGLSPAAMADSSTVATMYDPKQLQVRADVRLEDVSRVHVGQEVEIETPAAASPIKGRVITVTSFADIQKNTLQVKVSIEDPPEFIKPDMLVQVAFRPLRSIDPANEVVDEATHLTATSPLGAQD